MKKSELIFSAILAPIDLLVLIGAALTAYFLRFQSSLSDIRPIVYEIPFSEYMGIIFPVALGWLLIFVLAGLYNIKGTRKWSYEMSRIFFACTAGTMAVIAAIFFRNELFSSRFIVLAVWVISIAYVGFARTLIRIVQHKLYKRGIGIHRVALIGEGQAVDEIAKVIEQVSTLGYKVVARYAFLNEKAAGELAALAENKQVDEVIKADPELDRRQDMKIIDLCDEYHLIFKYAADLFQTKTKNIDIDTIAGIPIIELKKTPLDGWGKIAKRVFDIVGSVIALVIFSPLMLAIAIAIKLDSKGPVIYKNERVSRDGTFNTYKFRTMFIDYCIGCGYGNSQKAEEYEKKLIKERSKRKGPVYKILDDPRRTRVGRFLERISLDELPQFFNVLIGNMSLVGPRPHQPREVEKYETHHKKVLAIKPGITGLAQISGRSDLDFEEEVRLDTYYIENWSFLTDLYIALKTPFVALAGKHR